MAAWLISPDPMTPRSHIVGKWSALQPKAGWKKMFKWLLHIKNYERPQKLFSKKTVIQPSLSWKKIGGRKEGKKKGR